MNVALYVLICSEAEADLHAYRRGREAGVTVRIIRGTRCTVLDRCMGELAAALQLPYCFENTWGSFTQCLKDVQWPSGRLVLLLSRADRILPRAPADFAAFLRALQQYATSRDLNVILHTQAPFEQSLRERVASALPELQLESLML